MEWGGCEGAASPVRVLPAAPGQRSELLPGRARGAAAEAAEPELGCRGGGESRRPSRARRGEPRPRQPGPESQPVPSHARRLLSPGAARRVLRPPRREALRSGVISCFLLFFNLGRGEGEEGQVLQAPPPSPPRASRGGATPALAPGAAGDWSGAHRGGAQSGAQLPAPPLPLGLAATVAARTTRRAGRCRATALPRPPREASPLPFPASLPLLPRGSVRGRGRSSLQVRGKFGGAGSPEVQVRRARDGEGGVGVWEGRGTPAA